MPFVSIEGIDGSGKTEQVSGLLNTLEVPAIRCYKQRSRMGDN